MNKLGLHAVFPVYFSPKLAESSLWKQEITFEKGNQYLIVAPSGSGKSTLATALFGNHFHYEGTITYDGQILQNLSLEELVRFRQKGIQLLFQDVRLIPEQTIRENVLMRTFGKADAATQNLLETYAQRLGIAKVLDQKAAQCSYGERQRGAILRSLIHPADFLVYDECFSHLDAANRKAAYDLIIEVALSHQSAVLFFELNAFAFSHQCNVLQL